MSTLEPPPRLCVAIVVRDSAPALRETLASIQEIADEVVVLDTGSTDSTRAVAGDFGARSYSHEWNDDFSAARNACWEHCTGDWVLWLDAGEQLACEDGQRLRQFVLADADPQTAYVLSIQIPAKPGAAVGEQMGRIRLVPCLPGIRFVGRICETMEASLADQGIAIESLSLGIQRGIREHDAYVRGTKARRNIRIANQEIRESGPSARLLNCVGEAFQTLEDYPRAAEFFRHALKVSKRGSVDMLEAYYGLMAVTEHTEETVEALLSLCVEAVQEFPHDARLLHTMGGCFQSQGRDDLAMRAHEAAYRYGVVHPLARHNTELRERLVISYSLALQSQKSEGPAQVILEQALEMKPESLALWRHLIELHVRHGARDEAIAEAGKMPGNTSYGESLRTAVLGACLAAQQNWTAAKPYLQAARSAGCQDPLCLRWLTTTLLASEELDEARAVLAEWLAADPADPHALHCRQSLESPSPMLAPDGRRVRIDSATESTIPLSGTVVRRSASPRRPRS